MMLVEEWKEGSHMLTAVRSLLKRLILCGAIGSTLLGGSFALPLVAQAHQAHHQSITSQCKHCGNSNNGGSSSGGSGGGSSSGGGH